MGVGLTPALRGPLLPVRARSAPTLPIPTRPIPALPTRPLPIQVLLVLALPFLGLLVLAAGCASPGAGPPTAPPPAEVGRPAPEPPALEPLGLVTLAVAPAVEGTRVGGLSALAWDPVTGSWLALSDDRGKEGPPRFYTLELALRDGRLEADGIVFTAVTRLRDEEGRPFAEGAVDPEGLALGAGAAEDSEDPAASLWISSEGDAAEGLPPFVAEVRRNGSLLRRLPVPQAFLPGTDPRTGRAAGVRDNQAFEALTRTPGGDLLVAAEGPLAQDDAAATLGHGGRARILRYAASEGAVATVAPDAQYAYPLDPVPAPPVPADGLAVAGLVELLALDEDTVLALERTWVEGRGFFLRLYRAELAGAADASSHAALPAADEPEAPRPVEKSLLLDLTAWERGGGLAAGETLFNVEGMALGPELPDGRRLLVLVADDNFATDQHTQFLAFAADLAALAMAPPPAPPRVRVAEVQGAAHVSPWVGLDVAGIEGVVTAVAAPGGSLPRGTEHGFWMEDPEGDGDPATSEGLFVSTPGPPGVSPGQRVRVAGRVLELGRPESLTLTAVSVDPALGATVGRVERQDGDSRRFAVGTGAGSGTDAGGGPVSRDQALRPVILGTRGAGAGCPPGHRIGGDDPGRFDPVGDGLDFWESLEGMAVELEAPQVVGPTSRYGDLVVVAEGCARAPRTVHGGLLVHPGDFNPERLVVGPRLAGERAPSLAVGQAFAAPLRGVLDYDFGNYRLLPSAWPATSPRPWEPERTGLVRGPEHLTLASLNVENLSAVDRDERFAALARTVVEGLGSPDVVALQEVQDDSGPRDDGTVSAVATLERLTAAIVAAGGPRYAFRQVDPVDGEDGGQPGGNIRNALLFDPAGVSFVDRGEPLPGDGVAVVRQPGEVAAAPALLPSPGRLAPGDEAFRHSRKPLAAELRFHGHTLFLVVNHFASKGGDDPLMGPFQPPRLPSEEQRSAQARLVAELVESLLAADPGARVAVLGDLNDFEFRPPVRRLVEAGLVNLVERLPAEDRYSYVFQGNSQVLDHLLVSPALAAALDGADAVHRHADLPEGEQASDHDPLVARFHLPVQRPEAR